MAVALVFGARGLLGGAVCRALRSAGITVIEARVPWDDRRASAAAISAVVSRLFSAASDRYDVYWCAGAGVTRTTAEQFEAERAAFLEALAAVSGCAGPEQRSRTRMFVASSCGGVYAGSSEPPFTEETVPAPLSDYGRAKLLLERDVTDWAFASGVRVAIGRLSNLYGPGQDLSKQQGLISVLALNALRRRPTSIFVPLDTLRDYLFEDDAADRVRALVDHLDRRPPGTAVVKILASGRTETIGRLIRMCGQVVGRRPLVMIGRSSEAAVQARDLRLRSVVASEVDAFPSYPIEAGMHRVVQSIQSRQREAA